MKLFVKQYINKNEILIIYDLITCDSGFVNK